MDKSEIIPSSGDDNLGPMLIGINWAIFTPSTIIVGLRLITRIWITHNFGWDDAMILLAQLVNAVGMGFVMLEVGYGLGRHVQYLPDAHFQGFLKYNYLDWNQVFITLAASKISICLFLLRISKFERYRFFLFGLIAFIVLTHVPLTLLYMLQCIPIEKNWVPVGGKAIKPGHCFPKSVVENVIIVQGVISIVTDFIGAAFPVMLLWNAKLNMRVKVALNLLMGLGVITGAVCIVRTSYSWEIRSDDETWVGVGNALTRIIEVNFAIIGACAPVMRPLYLHLRSRFRPIHDSLGSSQQTSPSKLRWYTPPSSTPWYKRIFRAPAPVDKLDGRPSELSGRQEVSQRPIPPKPPEPAIRSSWPMRQVEKLDRKWQVEKLNDRWQGAEKPENTTWVKKDDLEAKDSDSFELPMQGARKSGYTNNYDEDTDSDAFKTYKYNRE